MPNRYHRARNSRHNNCRSIVTVLSIFVCIRIWISSAINLSLMEREYGHWMRTNAIIVGSVKDFNFIDDIDNDNSGSNSSSSVVDSNITNSSNFGPNIYYTDDDTTPPPPGIYCALLNYTSAWNEPVSSVSDYPDDCFFSPTKISVGQTFEIRYDPANPKQFIKQVAFEDEITSLSMMIGIGFALTALLFCFICRVKNEERNLLHTHNTLTSHVGGGDVEMGQPNESPDGRRERINSKMIFQTVGEGLSNTTADRLRALAAESPEENINLEQQEQQQDHLTLDQTEEAKPEPEVEIEGSQDEIINQRKDMDDTVQNNQVDELSVVSTTSSNENNNAESHQGNQILQMFSSWRRTEEEPECCICLEKYEAGEIICTSKNTECTHVFHKDCVMDWMKNHNQCPLCRTDMLK